MSRYVVEDNQGRRFIVEGPTTGGSPGGGAAAGPEGAKPPQDYQRAGGYGPFTAGVADSGIKAAIGLKQLVGAGSPQDNAVLQQMNEEAKNDPRGGYRTAGDIAGNIFMTAVPGQKIAGVVSKTASILPGALSAGVMDAAMHPVENSKGYIDTLADKGTSAVKSALLSGALGALGRGVIGAFTPTADAKQLFSQGINPTLQQGSENPVAKFIGGLTSGFTNTRDRQANELSQAWLNRVTGGASQVTPGSGTAAKDYVNAARDYVSRMYDNIYQGKTFPISPTTRSAVAEAAGATNAQGQFGKAAGEASGTVADTMGNSANNINVGIDRLRSDFLNPLAEAMSGAPNSQVANRIRDARNVVLDARNSRLSPAELADQATADTKYFDVKRGQEAIAGTGQESSSLSPSALSRAYGDASGRAQSVGNTTANDLLGPFQRVVGEVPPQHAVRAALQSGKLAAGGALGATGLLHPLVALASAPVYGTSIAGQTAQGSRFLFGQQDWQKALQQSKLAELLRNYVGSGQAGTALEEQ